MRDTYANHTQKKLESHLKSNTHLFVAVESKIENL